MPELPEVETIVKALGPLAGKTVSSVRVFHEDVLKVSSDEFCRGLTGRQLTSLERKGKYILYRFGPEWTMVMHLGMTGQAILDTNFTPDKHTHMRIDFGDAVLFYRDIRKFGFVDFRRLGPDETRAYFSHLGGDPFSVNRENFVDMFKKSHGRIKPLLLSQKLVSGIGNIYADETLFQAGISPRARAFRLSRGSLSRYFDVMRVVLKEAIAEGGSSVDDYVKPDGSCGSFQESHQVYGKAGQPCPRCGGIIKKIKLAGRGTSFCSRCQK